jgi:hypothetical protein
MAGVSPREILHHVVGLDEEDILLTRVKKTDIVDLPPET